jgi:hypothetical protein
MNIRQQAAAAAEALYTTTESPAGFTLLELVDANRDEPDLDAWVAALGALDVGETYDIPVHCDELTITRSR